MAERGKCNECGKEYALNKNATGRYVVRQHGNPVCSGAGQTPGTAEAQPSPSTKGIEIVHELWGYRPKQQVEVDKMGGGVWNFVSARLVNGEPTEVTLYGGKGGKGGRLQLRTVVIDRLRPPKKTLTPKKN